MSPTAPVEPKERISVDAPVAVARELPVDPVERTEILRLGLREWKIRKALEAYQRGEGTIAYAAHRAGVSLWEIGSIARAHGLKPGIELRVLEGEMTLERASLL